MPTISELFARPTPPTREEADQAIAALKNDLSEEAISAIAEVCVNIGVIASNLARNPGQCIVRGPEMALFLQTNISVLYALNDAIKPATLASGKNLAEQAMLMNAAPAGQPS